MFINNEFFFSNIENDFYLYDDEISDKLTFSTVANTSGLK